MTANEILADAAISHSVDLAHYSNGVVRRIIALLNRTDADLFAQLTAQLERLPPAEFNVQRLDQLLTSVRMLNAQAYASVGDELTAELRSLTEYEAGFQYRLFTAAIPSQILVRVGVASISAEQTYAAAMARPFQGRLLAEWMQSLESDRAARVRDAVRLGYVENQTIGEIVRRVRGSRAQKYEDGAIAIDRRNAEAVVRTAVSHAAAFTRDRFLEGNGDILSAEQWKATLDSRTSEACRIRDGLKYTPDTHKPIGHSIPWLSGPGRLHWNCRSVSLPVTKSWKELGFKIDELPPTTRASMDGQVPAELTYAEWLKKQSQARQDEVLGPVRAKLFRAGAPMDKFYNDKGMWLSLDQLRERQP